MKSIGFIDYYLGEWHAEHYPEWLNASGRGYAVRYAWAERDVSPATGVTTEDWCRRHGVAACETIAEVCRKSDCICILAPDNPEKHPEYAAQVLPFGKPVFIDKTFARTPQEAAAIFDTAGAYGARLFSSSALRFAAELAGVRAPVPAVTVSGGALDADVYAVHHCEIAVRLMGCGARRVLAAAAPDITAIVDYGGGRTAVIRLLRDSGVPFSFNTADGKAGDAVISSDYFAGQMRAILDLFDGGMPVDRADTEEVIALRQAVLKAAAHPLRWVRVERS